MAKMILDQIFKYGNEIEEGKEIAEMNLVYISKYAIAKKGQGQEMAKMIFSQNLYPLHRCPIPTA